MELDLVDYLKTCRDLGASDLHLCVGAPAATRVDGAIVSIGDKILQADEVRDLIHGSLTEVQTARLEEEWELDYAVEVKDIGRFRGNIHYSRGALEGVYRHIPDKIPDLAMLGHYPVVEEMCREQRGLILVTGITGSGKSTTLAAMTKRMMEQRQSVIVSIEDPIEFKFDHARSLVKQREIGRDTKNFPLALRQTMRQDPDVIVVSELRDMETIQTALTAAETGHLVLAGLHTTDAPQSVDRLIDVFPAIQQAQVASQLGNVLAGVISQRLIPKKGGKGRVMASEIMRSDNAIRHLIRSRKIEQLPGMIEIGHGKGMHTIDNSLQGLLERGLIERSEALAHARDRDLFLT